ncbi:Binding-protein-dependent transport systems inner membrane component [Cronobacter sakazakii 701]|nr:Binding-protein-dependent transport systems inner membrane component [Cronobacter sakazakii 701]
MVSASHCVGFTLPGMMDEPGSFSGIEISPMPQRGPLASQRTSLAIFISEAASPFSAPWACTSASQVASASNLLGAVTNGWPVNAASSFATRSAYSGCVFSPVPTAVPPSASSARCGRLLSICFRLCSSIATQPEISWPSVSGVASCRWVRPIFTISLNALALSLRVLCSTFSCGSSCSRSAITAATCIAVGKTSFELWLLFTSSFGCTLRAMPRSPPRISLARFASTSFMFMLVWVPEPVCQIASGNSCGCAPSSTSSAALMMASPRSAGSKPRSILTFAAARLVSASAAISAVGIFSVEMRKCSSERCVCAPQSLSAGTSIAPMESFSLR